MTRSVNIGRFVLSHESKTAGHGDAQHVYQLDCRNIAVRRKVQPVVLDVRHTVLDQLVHNAHLAALHEHGTDLGANVHKMRDRAHVLLPQYERLPGQTRQQLRPAPRHVDVGDIPVDFHLSRASCFHLVVQSPDNRRHLEILNAIMTFGHVGPHHPCQVELGCKQHAVCWLRSVGGGAQRKSRMPTFFCLRKCTPCVTITS